MAGWVYETVGWGGGSAAETGRINVDVGEDESITGDQAGVGWDERREVGVGTGRAGYAGRWLGGTGVAAC